MSSCSDSEVRAFLKRVLPKNPDKLQHVTTKAILSQIADHFFAGDQDAMLKVKDKAGLKAIMVEEVQIAAKPPEPDSDDEPITKLLPKAKSSPRKAVSIRGKPNNIKTKKKASPKSSPKVQPYIIKRGKIVDTAGSENVPKKPMTPFMAFMMSIKPDLAKEGIVGIGPGGKAAGERWRALSDAEKKPWEEKFRKEQEEYKKATAEATNEYSGPTPPKRPQNAYFAFAQEVTTEMRKAQPDKGFGFYAKAAKEQWDELSQDERNRREKLAEEAKAKWETEFAEFQKANPEAMKQIKSARSSAMAEKAKKKKLTEVKKQLKQQKAAKAARLAAKRERASGSASPTASD